MSKAFEYIQVPLTVVATDLTGASVEAEGAYFRAARLIAVNGPMTLEAIRRKIGTHEDVEQALNVRSSDAEPLLSFRWLEDWRERANAARDRTSKAGLVSAEKRAKKRKKVNTSSTPVEQQVNGSSTNVEHPTILYSTITQERKELASEKPELVWPAFAGEKVKAKWAEFIAYRIREKKQRYQSVQTEQKALDLVAKYFPNGPDLVAALDHTMARTWVFPVDPAEHKYPKAEGALPISTGWNPRA